MGVPLCGEEMAPELFVVQLGSRFGGDEVPVIFIEVLVELCEGSVEFDRGVCLDPSVDDVCDVWVESVWKVVLFCGIAASGAQELESCGDF